VQWAAALSCGKARAKAAHSTATATATTSSTGNSSSGGRFIRQDAATNGQWQQQQAKAQWRMQVQVQVWAQQLQQQARRLLLVTAVSLVECLGPGDSAWHLTSL
jgi:hypothetical protein